MHYKGDLSKGQTKLVRVGRKNKKRRTEVTAQEQPVQESYKLLVLHACEQTGWDML